MALYKIHKKGGKFIMKIKKQNSKGFTIIEVVLVLAIAGLIFLMVFVALPSLQRSQRDTSRKNDVGAIMSAVTAYSSNNRGNLPTTAQLASYVNDIITNSSITSEVVVNEASGSSFTPPDGQVMIRKSVTCGTSSSTGQTFLTGTIRQFAVVVKLESGNSYYCQNS